MPQFLFFRDISLLYTLIAYFFFAIWNEKELEPKGIPQWFVGLLLGIHQSAIGQFFPCPW